MSLEKSGIIWYICNVNETKLYQQYNFRKIKYIQSGRRTFNEQFFRR